MTTHPRTQPRGAALRIFLLLVIATMCLGDLHAQDDGDFAPEESPTTSSGGIFGAGGGVTPIFYMPRMHTMNTELARLGFPPLPTEGMFMLGGRGYAYIILVPNLRVGGMGAGGSIANSRIDGMWYTSTTYASAFGGVTIEYVLPFGRFHLAAGGLIGGGSRTLTLMRSPDTRKDWGEVAYDPFGETHLVFRNAYVTWQPWLTAEYEISPFVVAGLTGGWYGTGGKTWTLNDHFDIAAVPDFRSDGPFLRFDLIIGLFIGE